MRQSHPHPTQSHYPHPHTTPLHNSRRGGSWSCGTPRPTTGSSGCPWWVRLGGGWIWTRACVWERAPHTNAAPFENNTQTITYRSRRPTRRPTAPTAPSAGVTSTRGCRWELGRIQVIRTSSQPTQSTPHHVKPPVYCNPTRFDLTGLPTGQCKRLCTIFNASHMGTYMHKPTPPPDTTRHDREHPLRRSGLPVGGVLGAAALLPGAG